MSKPEQNGQEIHEIKPNTFIFEKHNALPHDICQEMIRRFESDTENQYQGRVGQNVSKEKSIKRSTDLVTSGKENWKDLDTELFRSLGMAIQAFRENLPFLQRCVQRQRLCHSAYRPW